MNSEGPIIIIEDDHDDQELFSTTYNQLNYSNELMFFQDGQHAIDFLRTSDVVPFIILSDINMPKFDGFTTRDLIHKDPQLRMKCIPYLFFSTAASPKAVIEAYSESVQGFFVKPASVSELRSIISVIMEYWRKCISPNKIFYK